MASLSESEMTNRGSMWELDQKLDQPMDEEAGRLKNMYREKVWHFSFSAKARISVDCLLPFMQKFSSVLLLRLAFQSLGVVFGDLGTSPLYVFYNIFPRGVDEDEDVIGALSLIIYTLTIIPLLKYVFVVLRANDNGQGGTFALYSLLCRHAKINTIPNQHRTDEELTTYSRQTYEENSVAAKTKRWLETHAYKRNILLIIVLIGTCTAIGDGILTPAISGSHHHFFMNNAKHHIVLSKSDGFWEVTYSFVFPVVLSASGGIKVQNQNMSNDVVVLVAVVILIGLFSMQHYGTDKVGWLFAPIVLLWFILIGSVGAVNIHKYNNSVSKAYNPIYIYRFFRRRWNSDIWTSLGGVMLSITGTEALFADLCHFPVLAIQIAFTLIVFPCLLLAYTGQAAYIISNKKHVADAFYQSIPGPPRPLMASSTTCTAVVIVMLVTTFLMAPIMLLVWKSHWVLVVTFIVLSLMVEVPYFVACILKIDQGGWVPLVIATAFFLIMYVWHFCTVKRYEFEMHSKVSMAWILGLGPSLGLVRVPGIGFVYTELASGVPHIFSHFITNLPAIHSVVVFVCVKYLPVYTVPTEERFLVRRIGPKNFHMFRCVARYGYKDLHKRDEDFEKMLFDCVLFFVRLESMMEGYSDSDEFSVPEQGVASGGGALMSSANAFLAEKTCSTMCSNGELSFSSQDSIVPAPSPPPLRGMTSGSLRRCSGGQSSTVGDELEFLNRCKDAGVVHILGNTIVLARRDSGVVKKLAVDYMYAFMRRMCRENSVIFNVPHESLLNSSSSPPVAAMAECCSLIEFLRAFEHHR
ncbi:putative potassium transporter 12 [Dichanthelium oligosanthes]|uniref:Putative potassium transporter 12 n=1 Tax=Dichanthelium oligosanthes TaxID=888268 RepID=A0A1E5V6M4_9POAL|nr:putative potassium transporter 12 [Dichanthelium oligosanthes]